MVYGIGGDTLVWCFGLEYAGLHNVSFVSALCEILFAAGVLWRTCLLLICFYFVVTT